jgi:hypothetical protein
MGQRMRMPRGVTQGIVGLAALLLVAVGSMQQAEAAIIVIDFTAEVIDVVDDGNYLDGTVQVGDPITGSYLYDSTAPDANPEPTIGDYYYTKPPSGITVRAGRFQFRTDPTNVDFQIEIENDFPTYFGTGPAFEDAYQVRSRNNISQPPMPDDVIVRDIFWSLVDPTATALSSAALPTTPPVLADWQSQSGFGLGIFGVSLPLFPRFAIRAEVTSAVRRGP